MSPKESVGDAKTVRACDGCLRCRARWYCADADAFLCHLCETSVHSANPLARRHERVRLRTASSGIDDVDDDGPTWHHGCKRKARSPRGPHRVYKSKDKAADKKGRGVAAVVAAGPPETMVPDIMEQPAPVEEEQLLYRVPTLKPTLSGFYSPPPSSSEDDEKPPILPRSTHQTPVDGPAVDLLLPSGIDLADLDVDVESLFGEGLAEDAFGLEYFLSPAESHKDSGCCEDSFVPVKQEEGVEDNEGSSAVNSRFEGETIGVRFNCGSEEEEKPKTAVARDCLVSKRRRSIKLSLDYEAVISAWSTQGCPWADGTRPQLNPDDCWPDYTGSILGANMEGGRGEANIRMYQSGGGRRLRRHALISNGGREARVSRYREKRRTRHFSKKIRYEVRKLHAEKRPRMKGRFVKRSFMATTTVIVSQPQFVFSFT